jgi:pimeloyl-ACP methyl ester carboxylesterase
MQGNTLHDLAPNIAVIVAHDGATKCVAAGHAFGNKVARALASRHPDLVRAVVMLAALAACRSPRICGPQSSAAVIYRCPTRSVSGT